MDYITQDILQFLKDTVMQIGFLTPRTSNPPAAMYLALVEEQSLGGQLNKLALLGLRWNLSS